MLINRFRVLFIIAFLIGLASVTSAQCRTEDSAPCKQYERADAIFIGTVKTISYSEPIYESRRWLREKTTLFEVKEFFKGVSENQAEIAIATIEYLRESKTDKTALEKQPNQGCLFYEFNEGERYLVFANKADQQKKDGFVVWAGQAMFMAEADGAIKYLRNRQAGHPSATLYGRVVRKVRPVGFEFRDTTTERPIRNIRVEIQNENQIFTTTTDEKGNYLFSEIPPQEYSIKVDLPDRLDVEISIKKVTLSSHHCTEQNIVALTTGRISGTVFSHDGKPKLAVNVGLIVASEATQRYPRVFEITSDYQSGGFEFRNIPPGQYFLGFSLTKSYAGSIWTRVRHTEVSPRTYYPGVADISQATLITLAEGQQLKDFDFRLLPPLSVRTISGVAVMPDGQPITNADIVLMVVQNEFNESGGIAKTDEHGRFSLPAYNGLKYWINANLNNNAGNKHSEPIELSTNGDVNGIRLVLTSSGKFCSLCYNKYWKRKGTPPQ